MSHLISEENTEKRIFVFRGLKVMIDRDLAELYQVPTKVLNQTVKRNHDRFPDNFMFHLSQDESRKLVTNCDRFAALKHSSSAPFVFTEFGVAMLSSVLRSRRAVRINIQIIQTFIRLRRMALTHKDLAQKIDKLERKAKSHDRDILSVFDAIRKLTIPPEKYKPAIGFRP